MEFFKSAESFSRQVLRKDIQCYPDSTAFTRTFPTDSETCPQFSRALLELVSDGESLLFCP
jgi:hypothetical protein